MQQTRAAVVEEKGRPADQCEMCECRATIALTNRAAANLPRNPFCLWSRNVLADFFAQGRLVCNWETTYVSPQSDAEAWIQSGTPLQASAAREGSARRRTAPNDTTNP